MLSANMCCQFVNPLSFQLSSWSASLHTDISLRMVPRNDPLNERRMDSIPKFNPGRHSLRHGNHRRSRGGSSTGEQVPPRRQRPSPAPRFTIPACYHTAVAQYCREMYYITFITHYPHVLLDGEKYWPPEKHRKSITRKKTKFFCSTLAIVITQPIVPHLPDCILYDYSIKVCDREPTQIYTIYFEICTILFKPVMPFIIRNIICDVLPAACIMVFAVFLLLHI